MRSGILPRGDAITIKVLRRIGQSHSQHYEREPGADWRAWTPWKTDKERLSRTQVQAEKTSWALIVVVVLALLMALLFGAGVFSR